MMVQLASRLISAGRGWVRVWRWPATLAARSARLSKVRCDTASSMLVISRTLRANVQADLALHPHPGTLSYHDHSGSTGLLLTHSAKASGHLDGFRYKQALLP